MIAQSKFIVVVDPAHDDHVALNRAMAFARRQRHGSLKAHILVGFEGQDHSDPDQATEVRQDRGWFTELLKPLEETGIEFTAELLWTQDWQFSVLDAIKRSGADMVIISELSAEHKKKGITDSRWDMLRLTEIPVLTVEPGAPDKREVILAAVNAQTSKKGHEDLNEKVLKQAKDTADFYAAELHVVNAYTSSEDFPDRDRIKRLVDIDYANIHVDMGKPAEIIDDVARKVNADLVVIGTSSRKGLRAAFQRNVSELVIEKLLIDVLTIN
jgi:universal stress protein E